MQLSILLLWYIPDSAHSTYTTICIESVDSILCRDSTDTQYNYDNTKTSSQNLQNSKLISLYDNVQFIFECFQRPIKLLMVQKDVKVLKQKVAKQPKCSFFFFFIFFFFIRQAIWKLHDSLTTVFAWNRYSHKVLERTLWTMASSGMPLNACAKRSHITTNRVSTAELMTLGDSWGFFLTFQAVPGN